MGFYQESLFDRIVGVGWGSAEEKVSEELVSITYLGSEDEGEKFYDAYSHSDSGLYFFGETSYEDSLAGASTCFGEHPAVHATYRKHSWRFDYLITYIDGSTDTHSTFINRKAYDEVHHYFTAFVYGADPNVYSHRTTSLEKMDEGFLTIHSISIVKNPYTCINDPNYPPIDKVGEFDMLYEYRDEINAIGED